MQMKKISTHLLFILKWLFITIMTAVLVGSATAWFLIALDFVTIWRTNHIWVVNFLPLIGLGIGFAYHYFGADAKKGNDLILEIHQATETTNAIDTTKEIPKKEKPGKTPEDEVENLNEGFLKRIKQLMTRI